MEKIKGAAGLGLHGATKLPGDLQRLELEGGGWGEWGCLTASLPVAPATSCTNQEEGTEQYKSGYAVILQFGM